MLNQKIKNKIESAVQSKIAKVNSLSGGCISNAYEIIFDSNESLFLKINSSLDDMFIKEANGLTELQKANEVRVPEVKLVEKEFILLEMIKSNSKKKSFWEDFGKSFARMHRFSSSNFGFYEDNYIGSNPQKNINNDKLNWTDFYFNNRILFQYKLAEKNGYTTNELKSGINFIESAITQILSGSEEPPSLFTAPPLAVGGPHQELVRGDVVARHELGVGELGGRDRNRDVDPLLDAVHREMPAAGGAVQELIARDRVAVGVRDAEQRRRVDRLPEQRGLGRGGDHRRGVVQVQRGGHAPAFPRAPLHAVARAHPDLLGSRVRHADVFRVGQIRRRDRDRLAGGLLDAVDPKVAAAVHVVPEFILRDRVGVGVADAEQRRRRNRLVLQHLPAAASATGAAFVACGQLFIVQRSALRLWPSVARTQTWSEAMSAAATNPVFARSVAETGIETFTPCWTPLTAKCPPPAVLSKNS